MIEIVLIGSLLNSLDVRVIERKGESIEEEDTGNTYYRREHIKRDSQKQQHKEYSDEKNPYQNRSGALTKKIGRCIAY